MDKGEGATGRKAPIAQPTSLFGKTRLDRVLGWGGVAFYVIAPILIGLVVLRELRPPSAHVEIARGSAIHSVTIDTRRAGYGGTPQPGLILCDRERKLVISRITPAMAQAAAQCSGPSIVFSQGGFFRNARLRALSCEGTGMLRTRHGIVTAWEIGSDQPRIIAPDGEASVSSAAICH